MAALIDLDALETRIGELSPADRTRADAFLDDASAQIRRVIDRDDPDDVYPDAPDGVPGDLVPIIVRVVHRALENPLGLTAATQGNHTWQAGRTRSSGVYLTKEDREEIRIAAGAAQLRVVTLTSPWDTSQTSVTDQILLDTG
ncbi:MAG: hypothetical protein ACODAF_06400 [Actinomycetota bacterium]